MFSQEKANRVLKFFSLLKLTKGEFAGKPFTLRDWQVEKIILPIFANVNKEGNRIVRTAYIEMPRKEGKSTLAAGVALLLLFADGENSAEVYGAAGDREQASIVFNEAANMVRQIKPLLNSCKILDSTKRIIKNSDRSFYRVLSAEHETKFGFNCSGVIFDELHIQPDRRLWDALTTSGGTRKQPLVFAITTAGTDRNSICYELHEYSKKILSGVIKDETFLPVIYSAADDDDWTSEEVWKKCNPALEDYRDINEMRMMCERAKQLPSFENTFRRLYLNQWVKQESRYIPMADWRLCNEEFEEDELKGKVFYGGLDLASSIDITAFVIVNKEDDKYRLICRFWLPADRIQERTLKDKVPYDVWVKQGFIKVTPGNQVDYQFIKKEIEDLASKFDIRDIAFDPWGALDLSQQLTNNGFSMVQTRQTFSGLAGGTKELLNAVLSHRLMHNDNPVLTWMADNLIVQTDANANSKPDKSKSTERIDGIVALVMALDRCIRNDNTASVYDNFEPLVI